MITIGDIRKIIDDGLGARGYENSYWVLHNALMELNNKEHESKPSPSGFKSPKDVYNLNRIAYALERVASSMEIRG